MNANIEKLIVTTQNAVSRARQEVGGDYQYIMDVYDAQLALQNKTKEFERRSKSLQKAVLSLNNPPKALQVVNHFEAILNGDENAVADRPYQQEIDTLTSVLNEKVNRPEFYNIDLSNLLEFVLKKHSAIIYAESAFENLSKVVGPELAKVKSLDNGPSTEGEIMLMAQVKSLSRSLKDLKNPQKTASFSEQFTSQAQVESSGLSKQDLLSMLGGVENNDQVSGEVIGHLRGEVKDQKGDILSLDTLASIVGKQQKGNNNRGVANAIIANTVVSDFVSAIEKETGQSLPIAAKGSAR